MARVELENIRKVYDKDVVAIPDANVVLEDQEFTVLVGPSGCGKSTMLRMIAGLEEISDGEMRIGGVRVNELSPKDRDIAMVFQNYALYPHMTVFDNMAFGLKMRKYPKAEIKKRVEEAAEILDLTQYLKRRPKAMSGGQRQRVAIGRAIVRKPKVFLFDEPLSNLDAKLRVQMRAEIKRLHQQLQATMVYVTHDQVEAMTMGDKIVVLNKGEVQQVAPPMELYHNPVNRFVGSFIGSPAMNFLEGELVQREGKWHFQTPDFGFEVPRKYLATLGNQPRSLTLGFRPEHVYLTQESHGKMLTQAQEIKVEVTEPIGAETFVYASIHGQEIAMRSTTETHFRAEQLISVGLDQDRLYFFDSESQVRLA